MMCEWTEGIKGKELKLADGTKGYCDPCIHQLVQAINSGGIKTVASCCGHNGRFPANIILEDDTMLLISKFDETLFVPKDSP